VVAGVRHVLLHEAVLDDALPLNREVQNVVNILERRVVVGLEVDLRLARLGLISMSKSKCSQSSSFISLAHETPTARQTATNTDTAFIV